MDVTNFNKDRKRKKTSVEPMMFGKVQPQAKEMESAVLGAIMLEKGAFDIVSEILTPESFYVEANQRIFRCMSEMAAKAMPIDLLTVVEELKRKEELDLIGGPFYVSKIGDTVVSAANIDIHSRIIAQKFIQRELIRVSGEIITEAYEDTADVFDLFDKAEQLFFTISNNHFKSDYTSIGSQVPKFIDRIERLRVQDKKITGVPSGFLQLDNTTHGWQPTDLIIIAARPSVGKTAFALNIANNAAKAGDPVGFFSLEMNTQQLVQRVVSSDAKIRMDQLANGNINDMRTIYAVGENLQRTPIYIDDKAGLSMHELRNKARRMVNKNGVKMIIIDYLQLMTGNAKRNANREQEISEISRGIKVLAKELKIPIIALSQLSREVEKRGKGQKIPQLSDLRESGAIEQDADMVIFLYRPPEDEVKEDANLANKGMAKIAKHRNGDLKSFGFRVMNQYQTWEELGELDIHGNVSNESYGSFRPMTNDEQRSYRNAAANDFTKDETPF